MSKAKYMTDQMNEGPKIIFVFLFGNLMDDF